MNFHDSFQQIQSLLSIVQDDGDRFVEALRQENIPHLSFSQISAVEFCPYRYYLQYVLFQQPEPLPDYFTKGKLLHQCLAQFYRSQKDGDRIEQDDLENKSSLSSNTSFHTHLTNALQVHQQNSWCAHEILAIEHPFVFSISDDLPPMVGIIDLILQSENEILLVDHKTGRNFYPDDELQVAIYSQYIMQQYGTRRCRLFYDHYRWVENLERIRKPAFQRTEVSMHPAQWTTYFERIQIAAEKIDSIRAGEQPDAKRTCFRCPYNRNCRFSYRH
ncbi:MAG: RecB family exonuclease [Anaerolineaceae bacterium]